MNLSLDHLNPNGIFNTAIREFCEGNPEPLALYIEEHGISPGYEAETISEALREPKRFRKRINNNARLRELLSLYANIKPIQSAAAEDPELSKPITIRQAVIDDPSLLEDPDIADANKYFPDRQLLPFKPDLVWREPVVNFNRKRSIYSLIARALSVTTDAVERGHKRMKE